MSNAYLGGHTVMNATNLNWKARSKPTGQADRSWRLMQDGNRDVARIASRVAKLEIILCQTLTTLESDASFRYKDVQDYVSSVRGRRLASMEHRKRAQLIISDLPDVFAMSEIDFIIPWLTNEINDLYEGVSNIKLGVSSRADIELLHNRQIGATKNHGYI